jgi:hypothetical protein
MAVRRPRPSKLDDHRASVGVLPDKQVAELAGVTSENVRSYRKRHGIPAGWRGETVEDLAAAAPAPTSPEPASAPAPKKKKRAKKAGKRKPRASKLDGFKHLLGQMPDRQLGEMAGVSAENVRAYRKRWSIPAVWREEPVVAAPAPAPKAARAPKAAAKARPAPTPAPAPTPKAAAPSAPSAGGSFAWRLVAQVGDDRREFVTLGDSMLDAVQRGTSELARLHRGGRILEAHRIAPVL